jgi:hypothetical protein
MKIIDCRIRDRRLYLLFYGKRGSVYIVVQGGSAKTEASCKGKGYDAINGRYMLRQLRGDGVMKVKHK